MRNFKNKNYTSEELPFSELYDTYHEHRRLQVFAKKGCECVECGKQGTKLFKWLQKTSNGNSIHVDLYAEDGTLMTVDHIIPKAAGGTSELENLQPMCCDCNSKKAAGGLEKTNALGGMVAKFRKVFVPEHFRFGIYRNQLIVVTVKNRKVLGELFEEKDVDYYLEVAKEKGLLVKMIHQANGVFQNAPRGINALTINLS